MFSFFSGALFLGINSSVMIRERSGSVVECLSRDQEAAGSGLIGVTAV